MFEEFNAKRQAKKEQKKIEKAEKLAETMVDTNERRAGLSRRSDEARSKIQSEEWYGKHLEKAELSRDIHDARQKLFIQRERILKKILRENLRCRKLAEMPDSPLKERETKKCTNATKNAAYALAVVNDAIERLDSLNDEYEWKEVMHDLTKGYKLVNSISLGSDVITRLTFLYQKFRMDMKGDPSVSAMESYYGKPIDSLLEKADISQTAAQMLVKDDVRELRDADSILEAVRWGTLFTVQPGELSNAAEEIDRMAETNPNLGSVYEDTTINSLDDMDFCYDADNNGDIPGLFR